ncbi:MAG: hypothetical protein ACYTF9_04690 [Planctomycetota bacterium]|jgi:hypothetical protein
MAMPRPNRSALVLTLVLVAMLGGCHHPSGAWYSYTGESQTFFSYETRQTTVKLIDLRNDQVIFEMDVPPGQQLTLDFKPGSGDDPVYTPDLMRYEVWPLGTRTGKLRNTLTVPAYWARRLDVQYTDEIEFMSTEATARAIRTDETQPEWWTPEGGDLPEENTSADNYSR